MYHLLILFKIEQGKTKKSRCVYYRAFCSDFGLAEIMDAKK